MNVVGKNEDELESLFLKFREWDFIFVKPGGNFGDDLIYWGAEFLAAKVGVRFRTMVLSEFLAYTLAGSEAVYIHGSGGFNRWCSGSAVRALEHALASDSLLVIQGPCTLEEDPEYIFETIVPVLQSDLTKDFYFMVRELVSFRLALELLQPFCKNVLLTDDSALRLTREEVLRIAGPVTGGYRLYGFRSDNESGDRQCSGTEMGVRFDPARFSMNFLHWIRVHVAAKSIITNRTHSSILGAILKVDTTLFPSRYHKNRSVWEFSLERRGVKWSDGMGASKSVMRNDLLDFFPRYFRKSYKVQRFVRRLQGVPMK